MPLFEAIRLALQQIRVQKLKSFFTLLGVTIGVMFLIAVVSIVEGMSSYMENDFAGNMTQAEWQAMLRRPRIYRPDFELIRESLPADTRYAVDNQENVYAQSAFARPRQVELHAVEGDYFTIKRYDLSSGRTISQQETERGANVIVIGDEVANHFFPDLDPLGRELRIRGVPYQVIGVIEKQGTLFGMSMDRMAVGPFRSALHRATNPRGDIDGIMVQAPTDMAMLDAMETVREVLRGRRKLRPSQIDNFAMETSASALSEFKEMKGIMTVVGTALPAIGLVVGGMVIMNIMLVAVAERTREIGIRKSLGARRVDIMRQFLVEAATLSTMGALLGIALGIAIAKGLSWKFPFLPSEVAPWSLVVATLLGTVVGIVSGVWPARKASRLDPIAALRQE